MEKICNFNDLQDAVNQLQDITSNISVYLISALKNKLCGQIIQMYDDTTSINPSSSYFEITDILGIRPDDAMYKDNKWNSHFYAAAEGNIIGFRMCGDRKSKHVSSFCDINKFARIKVYFDTEHEDFNLSYGDADKRIVDKALFIQKLKDYNAYDEYVRQTGKDG